MSPTRPNTEAALLGLENKRKGGKTMKKDESLSSRFTFFVHPRGDAFQNFFETLLGGLGVNANLKLG